MYQEQKKSINWKSVLLKLAFLIIVLILITLLLPINKNESSKEKSQLFIENMEEFKKVANNYYKEEDLPTTNKEQLKITLGELIRNNEIRTLRNKDGNTCDEENSFINITKNKDKYKVEIKLICDKEKDTIYINKSHEDFEKKTTTRATTTTKKVSTTTIKPITQVKPQITTITETVTSKVEVTTTTSNMRTVTFVTNSPSKVINITVLNGTPVQRPADPVKVGYEFVGWYKDGKLYDFNNKVYENTFIYASWNKAN